VTLNRRLAHEMCRAGAGRWEIMAVAPEQFPGELGPIVLERLRTEPCTLKALRVYFSKRIHIMMYSPRLTELLRQNWDMVHCWEEPYIFAAGQVALTAPRQVPLVFWTAQNISKTYPPPFCWIERFCVARCSGWMACGESTLATQRNRGYGRKPHRVMPLGVDLETFQPARQLREQVRRQLNWEEPGNAVVGYLGRFVVEKGVRLLMSSLDRVAAPWRALFVGGGTCEDEIRSWAERHGDRVRIVTGVTHADVPSYLNAMDILCAPSQTTPTWREQFGRMIVEAFACGTPVIASDSGEIPYLVHDAGCIVGEGDVDNWVRAIQNMIEDPDQRVELSNRGRARACEHYAWPGIARRHLDFFEELMGGANLAC
jgi:glycosyltransferase involved in cell wall biosynthesis